MLLELPAFDRKMVMMRDSLPLLLVLVWSVSSSALGQEPGDGVAFFENRIRPVLVQHCYSCHSSDAKTVKGGLRLDTRQATRLGGDSGGAIVPGNADESLLLSAIRYEDYEMPPKGQLSASVIADFEKWIAMGAPDPRQGPPLDRREVDIKAGRQFWAFQPPFPSRVPEVTDHAWPRDDIDQFLLARLEQSGLTPVVDADRATWLRRVSLDLTGLPPTEQQLDDFLSDASTGAKQRVVDRLLNSQHFGERWARHWLDVARYAESTGRTRNYPFPFAWRYRDYVIRSFNDDKPYDRFVVEQLAGDLLESHDSADRETNLTATGFLAIGSPDLNERDQRVFKMDTVADQIDTIGRSMLGLTIGCARCHDHKFDPIPTDDYYALAGIFKSTTLLNGYASRVGGRNALRPDLLILLGDQLGKQLPTLSAEEQLVAGLEEKKAARLVQAKQQRDAAAKQVNQIRRDKDLPKAEQRSRLASARKELTAKTRQFNTLRNRLQRDRRIPVDGPACLGVRDAADIADCRVHIRGDTKNLGDEVPRGFLQVLGADSAAPPKDGSGRLELAQWIASLDNPLTARVYVNRIWHQLFGQGIVRTVDNFGAMGARPTHPELLDYLAIRFTANDWSTKWLVRKLVLSRAYGLSVRNHAANAAVDAANTLLWRMNSRRLDYESMRDSILMVSGSLQQSPYSGSPVATLKPSELSRQKLGFQYRDFTHRSIYLPVLRSLLPEEMTNFDVPDASETRGARDVTTVPTQSLYLLNSPFVIDAASDTAKLLVQDHADEDALAEAAYRRVFGRSATDDEAARVRRYVDSKVADVTGKPGEARQRRSAWSEIIQAMFASAEFRYR